MTHDLDLLDAADVQRLARLVGEQLADDRIARTADGRGGLGLADERQLGRRLVARQLDELASSRLARGEDPMTVSAENALADAVLDAVFGLGRIQPLLDDDEINDIH
ncbi:MAG: CpaF family protein, partial [Acidimicrobiia bacterium]